MWDSFVSDLHAKDSFVCKTQILWSENMALLIDCGALLVECAPLLLESETLLSATCMPKTLLCAIQRLFAQSTGLF